MSKFLIYPVETGVKFALHAGNGECIAVSEVYTSRALCRRGVESVRKCAATGKILDLTKEGEKPVTNPKFELYTDRRSAYRFRLKARNGEVIAASEGYTSHAAALSGIESVITNAPIAEIEEVTEER